MTAIDLLTTMTETLGAASNQAKLAYQFSPGSYTWSALDRCLAAAKLLDQYVELRNKEIEKNGPVVTTDEPPAGRPHPALPEPTECDLLTAGRFGD
jgi:hypothetical protein